MIHSDLLGVIFVYVYVSVLLLVTEKILSKKFPLASRKILHILTGNIAFILPLFETREIMAFVAAGPFILFTLLMSPYSPIKSMRGKTSQAGHGFGLVYYVIAWTVLAYLFFDDKVIIAIGILAMSYGDGLASLLGVRFGERKYQVFADVKSFIGSVVMFVCTFLVVIIALVFYQIPLDQRMVIVALCIAWVAALAEGITPLGLDNLSVPFISAALYWLLVVM